MIIEKIFSAIFLVAVLILVLPSFLRSNSELKQFLKNLIIWSIIVIPIVIACYLIFR